MEIKRKGHFIVGVILTLSFFGVLFLIFSPIFGEGKNGLEFADDMFNRLSKGSSYFIPKLVEENGKLAGKTFSASIKMDAPEEAEKAAKLFTTSGAKVELKGTELRIEGDLGKVLGAVLTDADAMYYNEGKKISDLYGYDEKAVMMTWWKSLSRMEEVFKKEKKIEEMKIVSTVNKKAVETAYNYYGVVPQSIRERAGLVAGLLIFYIVYTMWWGFAILYLFEGIGLSMKKAKVKKEV